MSSKELGDRLRQQAAARLDLLRYRAGMSFEPSLASPSAPSQARFFFAADDVPGLCERIKQIFPAEAADIVARAERICQHRFDLLGYRDLDYGPEIDWHCDRVHGIRAPRKPGFKVGYLDFAEVGDSKVTWELNRHQHFVVLAKAYRLSGDEKFSRELFLQWKLWHRENPYPIGINWASSLEVSFRSLSWLWMYFIMSGSLALRESFRSELCRKLAVSGRHIEAYLSTYFSPNTHLMGEALALFFIGTLCPELEHASRWQRKGWKILLETAERQVREDGLHFEQSIYYHVYAVDFFLHAAILASLNGIPVHVQFNKTLERMLNALCVLGRAGPLPRLGDDDGGRLFDGQRNRSEHLLDPLAAGAVIFNRSDFKSVAGGLREESLWLLGLTGAAKFDRLPAVASACISTAFESSGLYVMTASNHDGQLVIDAGQQGADTAGHGHADALSTNASSMGRALLIDPGTFEYVGRDLQGRNLFRGTKAHNTLVVDGLDQSEPKGPFNWASLPNVRAEKWTNGETFDLFVGTHDGYARLPDPVMHRRTVFSLKSHFWLVRDQALGAGQHQLDLFWHLDPQLQPTAESEMSFCSSEAEVSIQGCKNHGWSQEVLSGEWSPAYGRREHHNVLHFGTIKNLPTEFVTLLLPSAGISSKVEKFARMDSASSEGEAVGYCVGTENHEHTIIFGSGKPWTLFPWSSDAEFFYWGPSRETSHGRLICCHATYVEAMGKKIVHAQRPFSSCEIMSDGQGIRVMSSDNEAVVDKQAIVSISSAWRAKQVVTSPAPADRK